MSTSVQNRRLSFVLSGLSSVIFATACYWLLFNSLIEAVAVPKYLALGKELQQINDPELVHKICQALVDNLESSEMANRSAVEMIRAASIFLIVSAGLMFLLSLRLLRVSSAQPLTDGGRLIRGGWGTRSIDFLIDAWEGKLKLWQAFWGIHILSALVGGLVVLIGATQIAKSQHMVSLLYASLLWGTSLVPYIFGLSVVWKNARNVKRKLFFWIARLVVMVESLVLLTQVTGGVLMMWPVYKIIALM